VVSQPLRDRRGGEAADEVEHGIAGEVLERRDHHGHARTVRGSVAVVADWRDAIGRRGLAWRDVATPRADRVDELPKLRGRLDVELPAKAGCVVLEGADRPGRVADALEQRDELAQGRLVVAELGRSTRARSRLVDRAGALTLLSVGPSGTRRAAAKAGALSVEPGVEVGGAGDGEAGKQGASVEA